MVLRESAFLLSISDFVLTFCNGKFVRLCSSLHIILAHVGPVKLIPSCHLAQNLTSARAGKP